jgi:hypothetical protein
MDRQIVYPGQILPETTLLQITKDAMIGMAKLSAAVLGTNTVANGFAVTPTGPASLQVMCAPGEVYSMASVDTLAFSTLPADTTHSILKQGIMLDGVTLSCPAPGTSGQSINYLVQVTYQDSDSTPVLLPYYNSANPAAPYSGIGNNGLTQNTVRRGIAAVVVKSGASANTGSQVTPSPDPGYIGLYVVTVAFGQTTITSSNITQMPGALLLSTGLLQFIQNGQTSYGVDTGTVNNYSANLSPYFGSLTDGMVVRIKIANTNTGASTLNLNGTGAIPIRAASNAGGPAALVGFEMTTGSPSTFIYNLANNIWILTNPGRYADVTGNNGSAFNVGPATLPSHAIQYAQATGRLIGNPKLITANGTYTPSAGMSFAIVEMVGGGGGSAHVQATAASQFSTTGGAGAGMYAKILFTAAQIGASVACTIGAGGIGATAGGGITSTAGSSTVFGSLATAGGGSRSLAGVISSGTYLTPPGAGGTFLTTSAGTVITQKAGESGSWGTYSVGSGQTGGNGGSSPLGTGGPGAGIGAAAVQGLGFGSGAGAGALGSSSASIAGAAGAAGAIIVWEYA